MNLIRIIIRYYYLLISKTPWRQAYVLLSFKKYLSSDRFRERCKVMGPEYAIRTYLDNEIWFWKRRVTKNERVGIFFVPYYYISDALKYIGSVVEGWDVNTNKIVV